MIEALFDAIAPVTGNPTYDFLLTMLTIAVAFVLMGLRFMTQISGGAIYGTVMRRSRHPGTHFSSALDDLRWDGKPFDHKDNAEDWTGRALRQIHVPMLPTQEDAMRAFYLGILGMVEMRAPDGDDTSDGFWAVCGTRQVQFSQSFVLGQSPNEQPSFVYPDLDSTAAKLKEAGHAYYWDNQLTYVRRLMVTDPARNPIVLIGA